MTARGNISLSSFYHESDNLDGDLPLYAYSDVRKYYKISISREKYFNVACAFAIHVHQTFIYSGAHGVLYAEIVQPTFNPEDDTAFVLVDYSQPPESLVGEAVIRFE